MLSTHMLPMPEKPPGQRAMNLSVTLDLLVQMCKPAPEGYWWRLEANPLPTDARVVGTHYDPDLRMVVLTLESAEWPEVPEGNHLTEVAAPRFVAKIPPPEPTP